MMGRKRVTGVKAVGLAGALVVGTLGMGSALVVTAAPAQAIPPPDCALINDSTPTSGTECLMPGVLGSGAYVSIYLRLRGAGGGGGGLSPYAYGGNGSQIYTNVSVPAGSTLTYVIGAGGQQTHNNNYGDGAGGGGSSALLLGSTLLLEAGGGGGSTNTTQGGDAAITLSMAGSAGETDCSGRGGNASGNAAGGARGSITGACAGTYGTPVAGGAGGSGAIGKGGAGASALGGTGGGGLGGTGYSKGGDGGRADEIPQVGGGGGGGGYGGGGGGSFARTAADTGLNNGAGGGAGSFALSTATATTTVDTANNYGYEGDGGNGAIRFYSVGPIVQTAASVPTSVTQTSAVLHSMINANGTGDTVGATVTYSTDPTLQTGAHTAVLSPASATDGAGPTNITATIASGLSPCTTYYYQASGLMETIRPPDTITKGAVASFKSAGQCHVQLPLTVKARSASSLLPRHGTVVVVTSGTTSKLGVVKTKVTCTVSGQTLRGDIRYCSKRIGTNGKVTVTTYGFRRVVVTVTQQAVPKPGQTATASKVWKRTWTVK